MKRVLGSEVRVGDVLMFMGTPHRIVELAPYDHPAMPSSSGIARDEFGWGITLYDQLYEVA